MPTRPLVLGVLLVLAGACRSTATPTPSPSATPAPSTLAACVGGGAGGRGPVVAGTETDLFTALSRQAIRLKPGVETQNVAQADGKQRSLTLVARDNSITMNCRCPGGCGEAGDGCVYVVVIGSGEAYCTGDCEKPGACCAGCGWF
jgi:hypothetical protein